MKNKLRKMLSLAIIDTCTDIASSVFTSADEIIVFPSFDTLKSTDTGLWIIGELLNQLLDFVLLAPIIIVALAILIICGLVMIKLMLRTFELALYCSVSPAFFACLLGDATKGYFKRFIDGLLSSALSLVYMGIIYLAGSYWCKVLTMNNVGVDSPMDVLVWLSSAGPKVLVVLAMGFLILKPPLALRQLIVLDRAEEMNANGFYLGTSGSGKSMYCKSEIIDTIIRYPKSEKIIIDPDGEYYPLIKRFGGDTLKLSADSETKINIFDTDINISENGTSAVAMKSELIMSIIETARGLPLSAADKSIIDSCVKEVYADYVLNNGNPEFTPTFVDFYNALINKKLPEADQIALDIELYVNGSFNTFSGKTNIHTDNKLLSIDISDMGEQLRPVGLQVILEYIWQRVRDNRNKGIQTWVWVDEFSVMFNDGNGKETVRSADFFQKVFKRIRKYGGIPTGITQNITEVLDSGQAKVMLSNSEFVVLLQQKKTDLDKLIELFNLSPSQSSYLQTGEKGTGLIVSGRKIIPFDRRVPKDSAIYKLCQTDFRREI